MSVINFELLGVDITAGDATSNFTTDKYEFKSSHDWSVSIEGTGIVGGPPTYTVEVSNNDSLWYEYNNSSTNIDIADSVADHYFGFRYMRVIYSANAASAGTVHVQLSIKNDNVD